MMNKHYDVFISYSRKDYVDENKNVISGNVVSTLKDLLKENQISYWFDEDGIYSGDTFAEKIASNIENASILLFISSENSNASKWTSKEIAAASMWKKKIIPVRIDHSPYNKSVMLYIADLDFVDYTINPEKAKEVIIESIKNQIEKEKQAEQQALEKHRQRQESLFRELTERIIRYNTEQKILLTSSMAIHKDIDHLEDAEKRNELKQMIISQNNSSTVDNDEIIALKERNYNSIPEFMDFLISHGVRHWRIFTVFPAGRAKDNEDLQLTPDQFRTLMEFIQVVRNTQKIYLSYSCEGYLGEYEMEVRNHPFFCGAGINVASIRYDGAISGCLSIRSHFDQGNIYRDSFMDVWNQRFDMFRGREWMR